MTPDSDEDIPQNTNHHDEQSNPDHLLILTSFSHRRGPLSPHPTPGLLFDVRSLPNPPKHLRQMYTGAHKVLREDLMSNEVVRARVDEMINAIKTYLARLDQEGELVVDDDTKDVSDVDGDRDRDRERLEVRVGVRCELGRHRSVACVEELARVQWPENWTVQVAHRDLNRRSSERDKEKRRKKTDEGTDEE